MLTVDVSRAALPLDAEPHLAAHLDYLRLRNQRPRSIRERRYAVLRAGKRMGHPVADVDAGGLAAWQRSLDLTPAGMHNEIVHVGQFLRWLVREGIRGDEPSAILVRPQHLNDRLPRPLGDSGIAHAMAGAEHPVRAWIALGAFCGLRCMEIGSLAREDVIDGVDTPFLRIVGKGGKERVVPLPSAVLAELRAAGMPTRGPLFARMRGIGPPSAMRVSDRINAQLRESGVSGTAHQLRHRFGTKLYEATHDPFLVAAVMGHASTETTKGYVQISPHAAAAPIELISQLTAAAVFAPPPK